MLSSAHCLGGRSAALHFFGSWCRDVAQGFALAAFVAALLRENRAFGQNRGARPLDLYAYLRNWAEPETWNRGGPGFGKGRLTGAGAAKSGLSLGGSVPIDEHPSA